MQNGAKISVLQCVTRLIAESYSFWCNFMSLCKCIKYGQVEGNTSGTKEQSEHICKSFTETRQAYINAN